MPSDSLPSLCPAPAIDAYFELGAGPLVERRLLDEENKVHPHAVMTWKGPAVDKLVAKKVLVTCVKTAENLDLSPVFAAASTLSLPLPEPASTTAMLHVPPFGVIVDFGSTEIHSSFFFSGFGYGESVHFVQCHCLKALNLKIHT